MGRDRPGAGEGGLQGSANLVGCRLRIKLGAAIAPVKIKSSQRHVRIRRDLNLAGQAKLPGLLI
jgi:hypothetical protein